MKSYLPANSTRVKQICINTEAVPGLQENFCLQEYACIVPDSSSCMWVYCMVENYVG